MLLVLRDCVCVLWADHTVVARIRRRSAKLITSLTSSSSARTGCGARRRPRHTALKDALLVSVREVCQMYVCMMLLSPQLLLNQPVRHVRLLVSEVDRRVSNVAASFASVARPHRIVDELSGEGSQRPPQTPPQTVALRPCAYSAWRPLQPSPTHQGWRATWEQGRRPRRQSATCAL